MSFSLEHTRKLLKIGDYEQAVQNLEYIKLQHERVGDAAFANLLDVVRRLCLICLEWYTVSHYQQQALIVLGEQLDEMNSEVLRVLELLQRVEVAPKADREGLLTRETQSAEHGLWQRLRLLLGLGETAGSLHLGFAQVVGLPGYSADMFTYDAPPGPAPLPAVERAAPRTMQPAPTVQPDQLADRQQASRISARAPSLVVYCLGTFRVYQHDQPIDDWPSRKGKLIFKYLVTHRERPIPKEVLMELLWPESPPDAARNNLNVAMYGLRQAFRQNNTEQSHILFQDDTYFVNPKLSIWIDAEEFQKYLATARRLEEDGDMAASIREYHLAEVLYQGEFLEEDRYEDWPSAQRARLQDEYISLLERLSSYYYEQCDYGACVMLSRKVLDVESCREHAHRQIMQAHQQQGQRYLAIRQYQDCVDVLRTELDVEPSPETSALYREILAGGTPAM